jgi:hypothetical protein
MPSNANKDNTHFTAPPNAAKSVGTIASVPQGPAAANRLGVDMGAVIEGMEANGVRLSSTQD